MGKGRVPCCDKNKVKRGPWSPEEDLKLITFIQKHGHENWHSLPKQAGLIRCGKSCRLRWINYLRPDVKRGNFTKDEEETIIKLHEALGNKWSKIAFHLPGRTDNEIKNVWNTHLKKRLLKSSDQCCDQSKQESSISSSSSSSSPKTSNGPQLMIMAETTNEQKSKNQLSNIELNNGDLSKQLSPTSFFSLESTCVYKLQDEQELTTDSPFDYLGGPHEANNKTLINEVVDEPINSNSSVLEIPFEADSDFWNMLDGGSFRSNDQGQTSNLEQQKLNSETRMWFNELDKELELLDPQAFDTTSNLHIWPSWPNNSGF